jgi:hypothetical protein
MSLEVVMMAPRALATLSPPREERRAVEQTHSTHRSPFLVAATVFANFYLILFAVDAALSVAAGVLGLTEANPLGDIQETFGDILILATLAMLIVVIFTPQLPKLFFLPLNLFVFWVTFGAPPFDLTVASTFAAVCVLEAVLIASLLLINKMRTGYWLMSAQLLPHKTHLVLRAIVSFAVLGIIMPLAAVSLLVVAAGQMIEKQTAGYLQFTSSGIEVRETVLKRDQKTVRLVGMIHVGESSFYDRLYASFPPTALVLAEGVTDRQGKLAGSFSYNRLAEVLGLKVQPQLGAPAHGSDADKAPAAAKPTPPVSSAPREPISIPATATRPRIIYADADVSDFSPTTVRFLGKVGEIYSSRSFDELMARLNAIGDEFTEADLQGVFEDILYKRNSRLLAEFDKEIGDYDTIIIPWGAQHMPGLESALLQRGFRIESQQMLAVARYQTIVDRLWEVLHPAQSKTSFWYRQKKWIG